MDMSIPKRPPPPPGLPNIKQRKDAIILATRSHTSTSQKNNTGKQMTKNARSFLRGHLIPLPEDEFEVEKLSPKVIPKTIAIIRRTESTDSSHMQQSKKKSVLCRFFLLKRNRMRRFHRTCLTTADDGQSILSEESFAEKVDKQQ